MKYSAKAAEVAGSILEAFRTGKVPKALANVYIRRHVDSPCRAWSITNRLLIALAGHWDARGFRQWQEVGRRVKKGAKASYILVPMTVKAKEDDPDRSIEVGDPLLVGFRATPVFGFMQTEGDPLPGYEHEAEFLDALPLIEVARAWGLDVEAYDQEQLGSLGLYQGRHGITLGTRNLSTWAHELVHAADDRLGKLAGGGRVESEVVAELGGAVLLECLGETVASDRGGAFEYIQHFAEKKHMSVLTACSQLLARTCAAVDLILSTADEVARSAETVSHVAASMDLAAAAVDESLPGATL